MNYLEIEAAKIELEFFDDPNYNYDDNEDDIIDLSNEMGCEEEESEELWDTFQDEYGEIYYKAFCDENGELIEYDSSEALYTEILKYAREFASIILNINDYDEAYNVVVSINVYGTGEQYVAENTINEILL